MRISNKNKKRLKKIIRKARNVSDYILDTEIEQLINAHGKAIVSSLKVIVTLIILIYLVGMNSSLKRVSSTVNSLENCIPRD